MRIEQKLRHNFLRARKKQNVKFEQYIRFTKKMTMDSKITKIPSPRMGIPRATIQELDEKRRVAREREKKTLCFSDRVSSFLASSFGPAIGIILDSRRMDDICDCDDDEAAYIRDNWLEENNYAELSFSTEKFTEELNDKNNHKRVKEALLYIEDRCDTCLRDVIELCEYDEVIFSALYKKEMSTFMELLNLK